MIFWSKEQWKKWSLPSKLTALGAVIGGLSLVFTITAFVFDYFANEDILSNTPTTQTTLGEKSPIVTSNGGGVTITYNSQNGTQIELIYVNDSSRVMKANLNSFNKEVGLSAKEAIAKASDFFNAGEHFFKDYNFKNAINNFKASIDEGWRSFASTILYNKTIR